MSEPILKVLCYEYQDHDSCSTSYNGPYWSERTKLLTSTEELADILERLAEEVRDELRSWEKQDPKWRDPKFIPPYRNIFLYTLTDREEIVLKLPPRPEIKKEDPLSSPEVLDKETKVINLLMEMYAFGEEGIRDSIKEALEDAYRRGRSDGYETGKRYGNIRGTT